MINLALWPLAFLAAGVVLELALGRVLSRTAKGWLAVAAGGGALLCLLLAAPAITAGGRVDAQFMLWDRGVPLAYRVDGLSLIFMLMATGIGSAILVYCVQYMAHEPEGTTRFYALMLTFIAGLVNLVASANLLMAYLSWEIIGLCSYFLVGFWYKQPAAANGARKVLIMTHLPGYGFLIAILLLYGRTGTFLWTDPAVAAAFTGDIFFLMLLAAMAKSVLFPLHTWIPEAMNAPTPVSALLHSACYVKAGVYLVARMYSFPLTAGGAAHWAPGWNLAVLALGCVTMLVGAFFALAQTDLKRLLAFSTISQLGHIITALGLGSTLGVAAGLFYCLSHGLFKGTLFLCAGAIQHATGTRDLRKLGGLAERMPQTAAIWLIAAAAIVGVPLGNGFVAKWLLYNAALGSGQMLVLAVAWLVSLFTVFYMLKATVAVFYGEMPPALAGAHVHEAAPSMRVGMGVLAALCILFGVAPQLLMQWLVVPAVHALGFTDPLQITWFGIQSGSAGMAGSAAAALVVLALVAGWLIYRVTRPAAAPGGVNVFTGGDPLPAGQDVTAVDFAEIAEAALEPVYAATDPDPIYTSLWRGLDGLAGRLDRALAPIMARPLLACGALAAVICALALLR